MVECYLVSKMKKFWYNNAVKSIYMAQDRQVLEDRKQNGEVEPLFKGDRFGETTSGCG